MITLTFFIAVVLLESVQGFAKAPARLMSTASRSGSIDSSSVPTAQVSSSRVFLNPEDDEEYFESEMDRKSDSEKLPIALGALGFFSLPFIVGLIYLYSNK